jgi:hypothetical protein
MTCSAGRVDVVPASPPGSSPLRPHVLRVVPSHGLSGIYVLYTHHVSDSLSYYRAKSYVAYHLNWDEAGKLIETQHLMVRKKAGPLAFCPRKVFGILNYRFVVYAIHSGKEGRAELDVCYCVCHCLVRIYLWRG